MYTATEIVTMKTIEGITKEDFIQTVHELETDFHLKQPGYLDSELLYDEKSDEWIIIQHWNSLENLKIASKKMFGNPVTEKFVKSLNPNKVKMVMLPQLGAWDSKEL